MAEDKEKKLTILIDEEIHKPARIKIAELNTSFQTVLLGLLRGWTFADDPEQRKILESRSTNNSTLAGQSREAKKLLEDIAALIRRDRMALKLLRKLVDGLGR
jgi:hypothetical protein